jgi:hypothetical protein
MAIFNVFSFSAEAEIMGKLRPVMFDTGDACLKIDELTLAEAKRALGLLSTGLTAETFDGQEAHGYAEAKPRDEKSKPKPKPKADKAAPKAKAKPEPAPEKKSGPAEPAPEPEPEEAPSGGNGDLVEHLARQRSVAEIVKALEGAGFVDVDALVAEAERVKADVPILARVNGLEKRLRRVWATLHD